jgi:hypothetical protein
MPKPGPEAMFDRLDGLQMLAVKGNMCSEDSTSDIGRAQPGSLGICGSAWVGFLGMCSKTVLARQSVASIQHPGVGMVGLVTYVSG